MKKLYGLLALAMLAAVALVDPRAVAQLFQLPPNTGVAGHLIVNNTEATSAVPAASTCGSGPAVKSGSTDLAGVVTLGTGTTACTITFGSAFTTAPICVWSDQTGTRASAALTVSTTTLVWAGLTASDAVAWNCWGVSGG